MVQVKISDEELAIADKEIEYMRRGYKYPIVSKHKDIYNMADYCIDEESIMGAYQENSKYGRDITMDYFDDDLSMNLLDFIMENREIYRINPTLTLLQETKTPLPFLDHAEQFYIEKMDRGTGEIYTYRIISYHPYKSHVDGILKADGMTFDEIADNWADENDFSGEIIISDKSWYSEDCYRVDVIEAHHIDSTEDYGDEISF